MLSSEDATQAVADGICGIAEIALQEAAVEMIFFFHMGDKGLDGGATSELALNGPRLLRAFGLR